MKQLEQDLKDQLKLTESVEDQKYFDQLLKIYTTKKSFFLSAKAIDKLRKEIIAKQTQWLKETNIKTKTKTIAQIEKTIEQGKLTKALQKELTIAKQISGKRLEQRIDILVAEMERDFNILKSNIDIYFKNAELSGMTKNDILADLIKSAKDSKGAFKNFDKTIKDTTKKALLREQSSAEIDTYIEQYGIDGEWTWITIHSSGICPDCHARAGRTLSYNQWLKMGLPGSGSTICEQYCRCKLIPEPVATERFPDAKSFSFDKKKLVLTTLKEAKILENTD
jgi:hypothetical protein